MPSFLVGLVTVSLLLVLATGLVQWRTPDGTLRAVLVGQIAGPAEGMRFR